MQLYDEAHLPVLIHDGIFILHANPLAMKLFRFGSLAEMLKLSLRDLVDEISEPLAQARIERLRADPEIDLGLARMIFRRADDSRFIATVQTRSIAWMQDVIGHELIFRSALEEVKEW